MSVLDAYKQEFDHDVRSRGRDYFLRGLVKITLAEEDYIEAEVRGGKTYEVRIDFEGGFMEAGCSCPYGYGYCKHIWATLLQAEKQGVLPPLGDDDPDLAQIVPDEMVRMLVDAGKNGKPVKSQPSGTVQPWKRDFERVRQSMQEAQFREADNVQPWPANRRVIYVVDVGATVYGNQALTVNLMTQSLDRTGTAWASPKQARISTSQIPSAPDPDDRIILQMLAGVDRYSYYNHNLENSFTFTAAEYDVLLKRMCQTGRCFHNEGNHVSRQPLHWDDGPAWEFWIEVAPDAGNERYVIKGSLRRDDERIDVRDPLVVFNDGLLVTRMSVARLNHFGSFALLAHLRHTEKPMSLAVTQGEELLSELFSLGAVPRLDLPEPLRVTQTQTEMRPHLRISPPPKKSYGDDKLVATLSYDYGGRMVKEGDKPQLYDPKSRTVLQRDIAAERNASARLDVTGCKFQWSWGPGGQQRRLAPNKLNKLVLELCAEGWQVEAEGRLYRQPGQFKIDVRSGIDWFELEGTVDFGNGISAKLPRLLAALRKGEKTVQLDDGTMGILPEQWLNRYGLLARVSKDDPNGDDVIRFSKGQVGLLDALVSNMPQATCDAVFEQARDELRKFEGVAPAEPEQGFTGELRPYQKQGLGWLHFLNRFGFGGCLADDMGLGKTVQVLALLQSRRSAGKPSLVVVPKSLIFNWLEEAKRFTSELRVLDHTGVQRVKTTEHFKDYDVILTTYGTMRLDAPFLKDFVFDYAILDEAQAIKNGSSESAKAARLIRADHRLALSGTPVQNHLGELWSLFEFLNPGMLGTATVFKASGAGSAQIEKEGRERLSRALRPFILRRTKEQVAKDLPEKTEQTIWCELDAEQRKLYDELKAHYRAELLGRIATEGINKAKIQILEALLRLRQAACHPGLIDKHRADHSSAKLDALLPQISEVIDEGHKVLVFSQFTSMLAILKKHLDKQNTTYEYLDGKTRDRQQKVERFQKDPNCKLFLISLKAGGLGLNLTAAEYVFLLDPWWNPAVEAQAIDRAHRIGQTRRVFAYRLIAKDTVEQKVLDLQAKKKDLADMILNADSSLISQLKREDLELLLA